MPHDPPLDPQNRAFYGDILRAPAGYIFDCAVATTYSLDFETALVIPATLAFHAAESRAETLDTPLALLEGLERLAGRIAIFCEAGRIHGAPKGANRLTALLEDTVTEVAAPHGGAFHPKLWLLRFVPFGGGPARLRLAILSRNLTQDISWDLGLCLDGSVGVTRDTGNAALLELIRALPDLAKGRATPYRARELVAALLTDLTHAEWDCPPGVDSLTFAVNGLGGAPWQPRVGRALGILSPFLTPRALDTLARGLAPAATRLLGRAEELAKLPPATLTRFGRVEVLDDLVETEEEAPGAVARGLHAKAFVTERYRTTEITVGSGNATTAALLDGSNVEVFATLSGPSARLGTIDEIFSPERLGRFTHPFLPQEPVETEAEAAAEARLEAARRALAGAGLILHCAVDGPGTVQLTLTSEQPIDAGPGVTVAVWPLVLGSERAADLPALARGVETPLGRLALRDVTRWIGLKVTDAETGAAQTFSLGTRIRGLPEGRNAEILRAIVANREAFMRYLQLLLADVADPAAFFVQKRKGEGDGIWGAADDIAVLENMVEALCGDDRPLRDVERLVERLGTGSGPDGEPVIPPEFLDLWATFRTVLNDERHADV